MDSIQVTSFNRKKQLCSYLSSFRHTMSPTSYNRMGTSKKTKYRSNQEDLVIYEPRNFFC